MILSALRMVDKRCAMIKVVRPGLEREMMMIGEKMNVPFDARSNAS
jgi:hypothetical protein